MSDLSRRKLITTGLAATAGVSGLGVAARLAQKHGLIPPDHGGIYGLGETLTYASQRLLTRHSLAREFPRSQISKPPLANEMRAPEGSLQAPSGRRIRRLAALRRRHGRPPRLVFACRAQELSRPAARSRNWRAKRAGRISPSGSACLSPTSSKPWESSPKPDTLSTSRSIPTGGTASTWPMPCIRRLFSPTA